MEKAETAVHKILKHKNRTAGTLSRNKRARKLGCTFHLKNLQPAK